MILDAQEKQYLQTLRGSRLEQILKKAKDELYTAVVYNTDPEIVRYKQGQAQLVDDLLACITPTR